MEQCEKVSDDEENDKIFLYTNWKCFFCVIVKWNNKKWMKKAKKYTNTCIFIYIMLKGRNHSFSVCVVLLCLLHDHYSLPRTFHIFFCPSKNCWKRQTFRFFSVRSNTFYTYIGKKQEHKSTKNTMEKV